MVRDLPAVIFRKSLIMRERDRRVAEDGKRQIFEIFKQRNMGNNLI
jgi:hypothetical protein